MKIHFDRDAERAQTRTHAGHVLCGVNADRKRRTSDPAQVTCVTCLTRLRCTSTHPHLTVAGKSLRCVFLMGHARAHFDSFTNRRWTDPVSTVERGQ